MRTPLPGWLLLLAAILFLGAPSSAGARSSRSPKAKRSLEGVVNINTASAEELTMLPGIGPVVAQRIVEARAQKPFERSWELTRVKGIGSKLYRKVENHVQTTGETTLRWREPQQKPTPNRRRSRRKGPKIIVFQQPEKAALPAKSEGFVKNSQSLRAGGEQTPKEPRHANAWPERSLPRRGGGSFTGSGDSDFVGPPPLTGAATKE